MKWAKHTLKPEQHELNGATHLAAALLNDQRVDALSRYAIQEHLAAMQQRVDALLNTKVVC